MEHDEEVDVLRAEKAPAYVSARQVRRLCEIVRRLDGLVKAAMIPKGKAS